MRCHAVDRADEPGEIRTCKVLTASLGDVDRHACRHASDVRIDQEHIVGAPPTDSRHSGRLCQGLCQGLQGVHELAHACRTDPGGRSAE